MRRFLLILLISALALLPLSAEEKYASDPEGWWTSLWSSSSFNYDIYVRSVMLRGGINAGGGLSFGITTDRFRFDLYGQGDYFLEPLGGQGGAALLEIDGEVGLTLGLRILSFWAFDTYIACDIGYYMQFLKTPYQDDIFTLGFNGLMVRPKLMTDLKIAKYYGIMMGVFYQIPIYPAYSDYAGFGIMLSIA